jgi:hypothetical protein
MPEAFASLDSSARASGSKTRATLMAAFTASEIPLALIFLRYS